MAWLALRIVGHVRGLDWASPDSLAPQGLTLAGSATLAFGAWGQVFGTWRNRRRRAVLLALGMSCGFLGDGALSQLVISGEASLVAGLVAFGLGHVAYIGALWPATRDPRRHFRLILALVAALALAGVSWYHVVYRSELPLGPLAWLVLTYAVLLASLAGLAVGVAISDRRFVPKAAGALLFLVSDLWIGLTLFNPELGRFLHGEFGMDVVWLTYGPAQFLIVYGPNIQLSSRRARETGREPANEGESSRSSS